MMKTGNTDDECYFYLLGEIEDPAIQKYAEQVMQALSSAERGKVKYTALSSKYNQKDVLRNIWHCLFIYFYIYIHLLGDNWYVLH